MSTRDIRDYATQAHYAMARNQNNVFSHKAFGKHPKGNKEK